MNVVLVTFAIVFSERAICCRPSVCCLSVCRL